MLKISILFSALCLFVIGCYVMFNQDLSDIGFGIKIENITPQISHYIGKQIEFLIKNYEPRCKLVEVANRPNIDRNGYSVSISFYVVNSPNPVQVETFLERLR